MQLLSCHDGKLLKVDSADLGGASAARSFSTGLKVGDRLLPGGGLGRGVIHEVLWAGKGARPLFFAAWLARAAGGQQQSGRAVWCHPGGAHSPAGLCARRAAAGGGGGGDRGVGGMPGVQRGGGGVGAAAGAVAHRGAAVATGGGARRRSGAVPATARGGVDPSRGGDAVADRAGAGRTNRATL